MGVLINVLWKRNGKIQVKLKGPLLLYLNGISVTWVVKLYGFSVLLAKAETGEYSEALDIIRSYRGGMLKMGTTAFREDFDIKPYKLLLHRGL